MIKCKPSDYQKFLKSTYNANISLMVYGAPGIGKSDIVRQVAQELAGEQDRKYREWALMSTEEKQYAVAHPAEYFILSDERISGMDITDLRGLPDFTDNKDWLITKPYMWIGYYTQPDAAGIIFFDEINLAAPVVAGQAYEIILNRTVSDRKISEKVNIVAAGNRSSDKAGVYELSLPLRDRFCELELEPSITDWNKWASYSDVNPKLISFINFRTQFFYNLDKCGEDKGSTPRGIARASKLISGLSDITTAYAKKLVAISVGESFATEFCQYLRVYSDLNWDDILYHPNSVLKSNRSIDFIMAVACEISGQIMNADDKRKKVWLNNLDKVLLALPQEHAVLALVMIAACKDQKFVQEWIQSPGGERVMNTISNDVFS